MIKGRSSQQNLRRQHSSLSSSNHLCTSLFFPVPFLSFLAVFLFLLLFLFFLLHTIIFIFFSCFMFSFLVLFLLSSLSYVPATYSSSSCTITSSSINPFLLLSHSLISLKRIHKCEMTNTSKVARLLMEISLQLNGYNHALSFSSIYFPSLPPR